MNILNNPVLSSLTTILEENPRYVFLDEERIRELAPEIAKEDMPIPGWKESKDKPYFSCYPDEDNKETIDWLFLINTINFCYNDFNTKEKFSMSYKMMKHSGSAGMIACIKRAIEAGVPLLDANYLKEISDDVVKWIFTGDNMVLPLAKERAAIFRETGEGLLKHYDGHFYNLVEASGNRCFDNGNGIVERLVRDFPSFNDVEEFKGKELKFYKRAQLAVMMTAGRLGNCGNLFKIKDLDELTIASDYVLPAVMKKQDILRYSKDLEAKIKAQKEIKAGTRQELEIRANTIIAGYIMVQEINKYRKPNQQINALNMDAYFWLQGRGILHHLTKTINY